MVTCTSNHNKLKEKTPAELEPVSQAELKLHYSQSIRYNILWQYSVHVTTTGTTLLDCLQYSPYTTQCRNLKCTRLHTGSMSHSAWSPIATDHS